MEFAKAFEKQLNAIFPLEEGDFDTKSRMAFFNNDFTAAEWADLQELHKERNKLHSGQDKAVGDKVLQAYIVSVENVPKRITLAEREFEEYSKTYEVIRVIDGIPVLSKK